MTPEEKRKRILRLAQIDEGEDVLQHKALLQEGEVIEVIEEGAVASEEDYKDLKEYRVNRYRTLAGVLNEGVDGASFMDYDVSRNSGGEVMWDLKMHYQDMVEPAVIMADLELLLARYPENNHFVPQVCIMYHSVHGMEKKCTAYVDDNANTKYLNRPFFDEPTGDHTQPRKEFYIDWTTKTTQEIPQEPIGDEDDHEESIHRRIRNGIDESDNKQKNRARKLAGLLSEDCEIPYIKLEDIKLIEKPFTQEAKRPSKDNVPDWHQHKIAVDTVKNPSKSLLGGPSAQEAEDTLRTKFGYNDEEILALKSGLKENKKMKLSDLSEGLRKEVKSLMKEGKKKLSQFPEDVKKKVMDEIFGLGRSIHSGTPAEQHARALAKVQAMPDGSLKKYLFYMLNRMNVEKLTPDSGDMLDIHMVLNADHSQKGLDNLMKGIPKPDSRM